MSSGGSGLGGSGGPLAPKAPVVRPWHLGLGGRPRFSLFVCAVLLATLCFIFVFCVVFWGVFCFRFGFLFFWFQLCVVAVLLWLFVAPRLDYKICFPPRSSHVEDLLINPQNGSDVRLLDYKWGNEPPLGLTLPWKDGFHPQTIPH